MLWWQAWSCDKLPAMIKKPQREVKNSFTKRFWKPGIVWNKKVTKQRQEIKYN